MDERDNWDNLSHGPTYSKQSFIDQIEQAAKEAENEREMQVQEEEEAKMREEEQGRIDDEKAWDEKLEGQKTPVEEEIEEPATDTQGEEEQKDDLRRETDDAVETTPLEPEDPENSKAKRSEEPHWTDIELESYKSFENCHKACEANEECFQYAFYDEEEGSTCRLATYIRLGEYHAPLVTEKEGEDGEEVKKEEKVVRKSGWMIERIRKWVEENECAGVEWP
nr:hypothetical protein [uncultured organism]